MTREFNEIPVDATGLSEEHHAVSNEYGVAGQPAKGFYEKKIRKNTMAEKMKCEYCEKDAIGYQGFGCCSAYVCLDHADQFVLDLKPGEKLISGECFFERY